MKIAIIGGSGKLGMGFVARLWKTNHEVVIGTRDVFKTGPVRALTNHDAAAWCEAAIVTIPYAAHRTILPAGGAAFRKTGYRRHRSDRFSEFFPSTTESGNSAAEETHAMLGETRRLCGVSNDFASHSSGSRPQ